MSKISRKNIEIFYLFIGVILIFSGVYSIISFGFGLLNIMYLILGAYMVVFSKKMLTKIENTEGKTRLGSTTHKADKNVKVKVGEGKNGKKA